jgi:transposase
MACDGRGRPLRFVITPGQANDMPMAEALIEGFRPSHVIADRGYDSGSLVAAIRAAGAEPVIPPHPRRREQRPYDRTLYRQRNVIERCFNRLKQFRRFATRYDRRARFFLAFIHLAAATIWLANVDSA